MAFYRIAGLTVDMKLNYWTEQLAAPYLCEPDSAAEVRIRIDPELLKEKYPLLPVEYAEYLESGVQFYTQLAAHGGMLLHASCVVMEERAYLFTGSCGAGKSTHTALWLERFGSAAYILNDDKPAIRFLEDRVLVYGTPWSGKHGINRNCCVPLQAVGVIRQAEKNSIRRLTSAEALPLLLGQTTRTLSGPAMLELLELLDRVLSRYGVYELCCNLDPAAAELAYETMSERKRC